METIIKIPFGSGKAKYIERDGIRTLVVAIIDSGDYDFTLSSKKMFIGGIPISLYFSESLGQYAIGIVGVEISSANDSLEFSLSGHGLQTRITESTKHTIKIEQSISDTPSGELVYSGFPISVTSDDEILTVSYSAIGPADETVEAFMGGIPILCHRHGNNWFLTSSITSYSYYEEEEDPDFEWN